MLYDHIATYSPEHEVSDTKGSRVANGPQKTPKKQAEKKDKKAANG